MTIYRVAFIYLKEVKFVNTYVILMKKKLWCADAGIQTPDILIPVHEVRGETIEATLTIFTEGKTYYRYNRHDPHFCRFEHTTDYI